MAAAVALPWSAVHAACTAAAPSSGLSCRAARAASAVAFMLLTAVNAASAVVFSGRPRLASKALSNSFMGSSVGCENMAVAAACIALSDCMPRTPGSLVRAAMRTSSTSPVTLWYMNTGLTYRYSLASISARARAVNSTRANRPWPSIQRSPLIQAAAGAGWPFFSLLRVWWS
ncbi:hypothetical protein D3C72_1892400 [compost metagenome]